MREKNEISELNTFKAFAKICELPIRIDTIEKKYPRNPDIQCEVTGIGFLAFELVQVMDQQYKNLLEKNRETRMELDTYRANLPKIKQDFLNELYPSAFIFIDFLKDQTKRQRKKLFSEIFDHLLTLDKQFEGTTYVNGKISNFEIRITRCRAGSLRFSIAHGGSFSDPVMSALKSKFGKKYETKYPIHLLAYIDNTPMVPEHIWLPDAEQFIQEALQDSQFEKVWIFDAINNEIKMGYPS